MTRDSGDRWITVPRWEEFQHRDAARTLVPTWVKTFTRLLSDEAYLNLTGPQRAALHGIWLEYARTRRNLPENTASLSRRLNLRITQKTLDALNHAGFIELSASKPASNDASTPASTEKRREEELPKAVTSHNTPHHNGTGFANTPAATNERPQDFTQIGELIDQSLRTAGDAAA